MATATATGILKNNRKQNSKRKVLRQIQIFTDLGVRKYSSGKGYWNQWVIGKDKVLELTSIKKNLIFE